MERKWNESLTTFQKAAELDPANVCFRRETPALQWHLGLMDAAEKNLGYIPKKSGPIRPIPVQPCCLAWCSMRVEITGMRPGCPALDSIWQSTRRIAQLAV
jgi:hypothetical protein